MRQYFPQVPPSYHPRGGRRTYWSSTMLPSAASLTVGSTAALSAASTTFAADSSLPPQFTPEMVSEGIKRAGQSTTRGLDGFSYPHLKHLGLTALRVLVDIFNLSVRLNTIRTWWKLASIVPLLKPGKPSTLAAFYQPISLLSTLSKILERLVLDKILTFIPLSASQHGFQSLHSTSTLLTLYFSISS